MSAPSWEDAVRAAQDALREGGAHGNFNALDALAILGRALLAERERAASEYARGLAEGREQALKAAREAWGGPAHTYASENADIYRAGDAMAGRIIRALTGSAKEEDDDER